MQINASDILKKFNTSINDISSFPKSIIIYGTKISLVLLLLGGSLFFFNKYIDINDMNNRLISIPLIKSSYTILAESIISGLVIDYIFKKQ